MAGELQASYIHGSTCYFLIRNATGNIYSTVSSGFVTYQTSAYSGYTISASEQGTASSYFVGTMPPLAAGTYSVVMKSQIAAITQESDPTVDAGQVEWNGTALTPLSDSATSGQVSQIIPIRLARSQMVQNYPIFFRSSADHVTLFTSGVVSGQISRDGGAFGPLQSGAFTEIGNGAFKLQALTSGDLAANTVALLFTANGISGGAADPVPQAFVLQRVSGY